MSFTKLDSSLTASSIWAEPDSVRILWVTMLSMADKDGNVKASVPGLAHLARKTIPEAEHALSVLLAPDPHSGRKELDGRRLTEIAGGWHLVTHAFYRESGMSDETKKYWRDKKQAQRAAKREKKSKTVRDSPPMSAGLASASGYASASVPEILDTEAFRTAWDDWQAHRKEIKKPLTKTSIKGQLAQFAEWGEQRAIAAIRHTIRKGWQGLAEAEASQGVNGAAAKPRALSFDERKRKIGKLRDERNNLFKMKQYEHREFTPEEAEEYRKLTQELQTMEAE